MDASKIFIDKKESLGELENLINNDKLFKLDDTCNEYYYIAMEDDYIIGIACNSYGMDVKYMFADNDTTVYIGIGMHLLCLDIKNKDVYFNKKLPSIFVEILTDSSKCYYVIVCELDLYVYRNNKLLWKIGFRDIVIDYELIDDKCIRILSEGGEETTFSMLDGNIIE